MGTRIGDPGDVLYEEPGPAQDPRLAESSWKEYNLLSLGTTLQNILPRAS